MTLTQPLSPNLKEVTINGQRYKLIAFYYPDRDTPWDTVYQGQFLANFYPCKITLTIKGITGTFLNSEAAFQATKWWENTDYRKAFETKTGTEAYNYKKKLPDGDVTYAGLGQSGAMKKVLTEKFRDPTLKQGLLLTANAYLLEHREKFGQDRFWSDANDGTGSNKLGQTLMEVRKDCGGVGAPDGNYDVVDFTNHLEPKE